MPGYATAPSSASTHGVLLQCVIALYKKLKLRHQNKSTAISRRADFISDIRHQLPRLSAQMSGNRARIDSFLSRFGLFCFCV